MSSQHHTRTLVLQSLYRWLLTGHSAEAIAADVDFSGANQQQFHDLLNACIEEAPQLREKLSPWMNRPLAQTAPVEQAILLLGACELLRGTQPKIVLNEMVLLAKEFGGTNGHKFVNGVLDKLARHLSTAAH